MADATLFTYMQQVQRLMRDGGQRLMNPDDLIQYINLARREVAMRSQCVRILPPISGAITTGSVVSGGVSYGSNCSVVLTAPDFPGGGPIAPNGSQATVSFTAVGGSIAAISIDDGGAGYFQPSMSIVDNDTGYSAASIVLSVGGLNVLNTGQEVYRFADIDLSQFPGVEAIHAVNSVSIIYSNYRYSLPKYAFSTYQAFIRQYPFQYQYVPSMFAQKDSGTSGSLYFYPLPSDTYQMEWDCYCTPQDLVTNQSVEAIPAPWTDAVQYMACYFAYLSLQNFNYAAFMEKQFEKYVARYGTYSRPGRWSNMYGRFLWPIVAAVPAVSSLIS